MCPVGCNVNATTREGKVKRILSRNHPEVDDGWLCDKGRFAYATPARRGPAARPDPARAAPRLRGGVLGAGARRGRAAAPRGGRTHRHRALRLRDGRAGLRARQAPAPRARRAHRPLRRRDVGCARRIPRPALRDPRRRCRGGARRRTGGRARADRRALDQGSAPTRRPRAVRARRGRGARCRPRDPDLVRYDGGHGGATVASLAQRLGASGAFYIPDTANGRGVCDAWSCSDDAESAEPRPGRPADRLRRRGRGQPGRPRSRGEGRARHRDLDVPGPRRRLGGSRPPGDELPRARRDVRQPRGTHPAAAPHRHPTCARRAGVDLEARRALRASSSLPIRRSCSRRSRRSPSAGSRSASIGDRAPLPAAHRRDRADRGACRTGVKRRAGLRLVRYRPLFSGPAVDRVPRAAVPAAAARGGAVGAGRALAWNPQRRGDHASARTAPRSRCARA